MAYATLLKTRISVQMIDQMKVKLESDLQTLPNWFYSTRCTLIRLAFDFFYQEGTVKPNSNVAMKIMVGPGTIRKSSFLAFIGQGF